jgi:hypothetical protein
MSLVDFNSKPPCQFWEKQQMLIFGRKIVFLRSKIFQKSNRDGTPVLTAKLSENFAD